MRIHTDVFGEADVWRAAAEAEVRAKHGQIRVVKMDAHGSRSHQRAFEVLLEGDGSVNRRKPGHSGVDYSDADQYAASYDSWGFFLAHLFALDPGAKATYYADATDFHRKTDGRFEV